MDAILLVLRTRMQWNALKVTGSARAPRRPGAFQEWVQAGLFREIWRQGLLEYDAVIGIDCSFLACDGAMTKAPLSGEETRPKAHRQNQEMSCCGTSAQAC